MLCLSSAPLPFRGDGGWEEERVTLQRRHRGDGSCWPGELRGCFDGRERFRLVATVGRTQTFTFDRMGASQASTRLPRHPRTRTGSSELSHQRSEHGSHVHRHTDPTSSPPEAHPGTGTQCWRALLERSSLPAGSNCCSLGCRHEEPMQPHRPTTTMRAARAS